MKRDLQLTENSIIEGFLDRWNCECVANEWQLDSYKRLRTCSACVRIYHNKRTGERVAVLQSYATDVAVVLLDSSIGLDFLRFVYGYTSTSSQHISKFFNDYSVKSRKTYRYVKVVK